jgi:expansin (peptidoglycan-binding protein)
MSLVRLVSASFAVAALAFAPQAGAQACAAPITGSGNATSYEYSPGAGACGLGDVGTDLIAAVANADFAGSASCGRCLRVSSGGKSVDVRVVDLCPSCSTGQLDLSLQAFAVLAPPAAGIVPVTWQTIACPVTGNVSVRTDAANPFYVPMQVRNHRYGVTRLEYQSPTGFVNVPRASWNYFILDSSVAPTPYPNDFAIRITDVNGSVLVQSNIDPVPNTIFPGTAQFPLCGVAAAPALGGSVGWISLALLAGLLLAAGVTMARLSRA